LPKQNSKSRYIRWMDIRCAMIIVIFGSGKRGDTIPFTCKSVHVMILLAEKGIGISGG